MTKFKIYIWLCLVTWLMYACNKKDVIAVVAENIFFVKPSNFPAAAYQFEENELTAKGFALGKKLFYEARLSADQSVSCGSCHQQFGAFAQLDHTVSHGVNNCLGKRNAPALFNLAWQREFFWDGGAKNLEIVPINAITDACEMGTSLSAVVQFLNRTEPYPQLFKDTFGVQTIGSKELLRALAQFMANMVSANSKYDQVSRDPQRNSFTADEKIGYQLFKDNCANCHAEPLFTDQSYANNGLDSHPADEGRKIITGLATDLGKFKIPTLRNIELSAPYMHDGRFKTLDQVLAHYDSGVKRTATLAPALVNGDKVGIPLSTLQKQQLISFLKTLTDHDFIKNKAFSE
jgi:cytochrome c peroxidase